MMMKNKNSLVILPNVDVPEVSYKTGVKLTITTYPVDSVKKMKETVKTVLEFGVLLIPITVITILSMPTEKVMISLLELLSMSFTLD